ncbi:MAG: alpha/beta hydrolase [Bellilinea sp.]
MNIKPVDLAYEEIGQGTPVLLVHGFPVDHTIWLQVAEGLKDEARVIMPDLRGFGDSPDSNEVFTMRLLAEDLLALIDRLKLEKVVLVGHSMAGYAALAFAHAYPNRLAGLGLVATQADADTPERRQARLVTARETKRRGVHYIADGMPSKLTQNVDIQQQLHEIIMKCRTASLVNALKGMADRSDANPWLAAIAVPTVVIAGRNDQTIPLQRSVTLAQMLSKGWLVEIPEAGHMPMLETPQEVISALRQLICHVAGCG